MFEGGTDTTHTNMEWAMAELLRHPKILKQLQNELRQKANGKSEITEDDLDRMQCLQAVIKDVLSLHAPVPLLLARGSPQDVKVMGYDSAAGTQVLVNAWQLEEIQTFWDNPEGFSQRDS